MARARRVTSDGRKVLTGPPADSVAKARHETVPAGTLLRRVYWPEPWETTATSFRHNGPRARFDHQRRPGPFPDAADDKARGIFYCAPSFECCILECFGDDYLIDPTGAWLTVLETIGDLRVLDIRGPAAVNAGTLAAINQDGDREVTQDWARWWYEHQKLGVTEGLLFSGAHNDEDALAVFERASGRFTPVFDQPLDAPEVLAELIVVADQLELPALTLTCMRGLASTSPVTR